MSRHESNVRGTQILDAVAAKAAVDPDYRQNLLDNPEDVLRSEGLTVGDDVKVVIHEQSDTEVHFVLAPPEWLERELDLDEVDVLMVCLDMHF